MKIAYITAGAAGMYCGTCLHDNTLAAALMERGHEVSLTPTYTPTRTDEQNVANQPIFFGAVNAYLRQKYGVFRHMPRAFDRILDNPKLLNWVSRFNGSTDANDLGSMTLSILQGESGPQVKELDRMAGWMEDYIQPEIIHISHTLFSGFARRLKERLDVPVVSSLQGEDLFFDDLEEPYYSLVRSELRQRALDIDAFISPSRFYADTMSENYGIPRERIHIARMGVKASDFIPAETRGTDELVIGNLARFAPEKGTHLALEAFKELTEILDQRPDSPRVRLRVAGFLSEKDRAYHDEQRRRVTEWGLDDRVDFVGEVDRQGKLDFFTGLDLFTMPTVYREPKGLPVLEAMASRVPVVQPRHGSFPEIVEDTGGGLLVEPDSATALAQGFLQLVDDHDRRRSLAEAGHRSVHQRYDEHTMADETLSIYDGLLGGASGAGFQEPALREAV